MENIVTQNIRQAAEDIMTWQQAVDDIVIWQQAAEDIVTQHSRQAMENIVTQHSRQAAEDIVIWQQAVEDNVTQKISSWKDCDPADRLLLRVWEMLKKKVFSGQYRWAIIWHEQNIVFTLHIL